MKNNLPPVKEPAIQLLEKMLTLDPAKRISAIDAIKVCCDSMSLCVTHRSMVHAYRVLPLACMLDLYIMALVVGMAYMIFKCAFLRAVKTVVHGLHIYH